MIQRSSAALLVPVLMACAAACNSPKREAPPSKQVAELLAAGIRHSVEQSSQLLEPFRCAEAIEQTGSATLDLSGIDRVVTIRGDIAEVSAGKRRKDRRLLIGVVADARGADPDTLAELGRATKAFEEAGVELVVSLGGLAEEQRALAAMLRQLASGPWLVYAAPGDREDVAVHRATIAELAAGGSAILDGSVIRQLTMDGVVLASLPGAAHRDRLLAGSQGCVHRSEDADQLANRLAGTEGVRVWLSHTPPRQRGARASDAAIEGIHVGEIDVADAVTRSAAHVVLHGLVDQAGHGAPTGTQALVDGSAPLVLGAGSIDATPTWDPGGPAYHGAALTVEIAPRLAKWRRIRTAVASKPSAR